MAALVAREQEKERRERKGKKTEHVSGDEHAGRNTSCAAVPHSSHVLRTCGGVAVSDRNSCQRCYCRLSRRGTYWTCCERHGHRLGRSLTFPNRTRPTRR